MKYFHTTQTQKIKKRKKKAFNEVKEKRTVKEIKKAREMQDQ